MRAVVVCQFCGTSHHVAAPALWAPPPTMSAPVATDLHTRLLSGPLGAPVGSGQRFTPAALPAGDPAPLAHGVWARTANASSTYGGSWSPNVLCGPPSVYPDYGDRSGAWAPLSRASPVEWVETHYDGDVPCSAVRVYETNEAGAAFAMLVDDGRGEELVWASAPERVPESRALEVALAPPRAVRRVRVYLANNLGSSWAEIDSIGLMSAAPLAEARRVKPAPRRAPTTGCSGEFSSASNAAAAALGAPDVYPTHGDVPRAWASRSTRDGFQWIQVRFPAPVRARSLVWVETLNPGAVARVDVTLAQGATATVFEGAVASPGLRAVVWTLPFASPLDVTEVRIVLDTNRVAGRNEIDAIGLEPAGP